MSKVITVGPGDCLINISRQEGFFWETIWKHPENQDLRQLRKNFNIIKKGDRLFIPDRSVKQLPRPTEQLHKFVRKGVPARFTLTLLDRGIPRANEQYTLIINDISRDGTTDADGKLSEPIPPEAREGTLIIGKNREEITLDFGFIDPIEEISGVKSRLRNLGFYEGEIDDELTPETTTAIAEFQRSINITGEGALTSETRDALVQVHGS